MEFPPTLFYQTNLIHYGFIDKKQTETHAIHKLSGIQSFAVYDMYTCVFYILCKDLLNSVKTKNQKQSKTN